MMSRSKKRNYRQQINPPTKLQKMAREMNWLLGFAIKPIHIPRYFNYSLKLSEDTEELCAKINTLIYE